HIIEAHRAPRVRIAHASTGAASMKLCRRADTMLGWSALPECSPARVRNPQALRGFRPIAGCAQAPAGDERAPRSALASGSAVFTDSQILEATAGEHGSVASAREI